MPNILSRAEPPQPWPTDFKEDGAIHGDLPLVVPRPKRHSSMVFIVKRENCATFYDFYHNDEPIRFRIDTKYEWLLLCGLNLSQGEPYRMYSCGVPLARIIALHNPSTDPSRNQIDHANRDCTNDCEANLHWVTPQFNAFNGKGNSRSKSSGYDNAETAALVYNLVCNLNHGDQLAKTPHLLNKIPHQETRVTKIESFNGGVDLYKVDDIFIVIYEDIVRHYESSLAVAKEKANRLIEKEEEERKEREEKWAKRKSWIRVGARENGVAVISLLETKDDVIDVLLDDDDWKMFYAMDANLFLTRH